MKRTETAPCWPLSAETEKAFQKSITTMDAKPFCAIAKMASKFSVHGMDAIELSPKGLRITDVETHIVIAGMGEIKETVAVIGLPDIVAMAEGEDTVELTIDSETVGSVQAGEYSAMLEMRSPGDAIPPVPSVNIGEIFSMEFEEFKAKAEKAARFAAAEKIHFSLHGVCFDFAEQGHGAIVGTDGRRLAIFAGPTPVIPDSIIMPVIGVKRFFLACKAVGQDTGHVIVSRFQNYATMQCGRVTVSTMVIDGKYPDYRRVMPNGNGITMECIFDGPAQKKALKKAIKLTGKAHGSSLKTWNNGTQTAWNGKTEYRIPSMLSNVMPGFEEDGDAIHINPQFLREFTDAEYRVTFYGCKKALKLTGNGGEFALMPIIKK